MSKQSFGFTDDFVGGKNISSFKPFGPPTTRKKKRKSKSRKKSR